MKTYYQLIKEDIIDFNKALFNNYSKLNLNEIECIILYNLHELEINGCNEFNVSSLVSKMSISFDEISNIIIELVNKGFVSLSLKDDIEVFDIDGTYKKLGFIYEGQEESDSKNLVSIEMKEMMQKLEKDFNHIITPNELSVVKKWFYDYKYDVKIINEEIDRAKTKKTGNINMVDRALYNRLKALDISNEDAKSVVDLFNKTYGNK